MTIAEDASKLNVSPYSFSFWSSANATLSTPRLATTNYTKVDDLGQFLYPQSSSPDNETILQCCTRMIKMKTLIYSWKRGAWVGGRSFIEQPIISLLLLLLRNLLWSVESKVTMIMINRLAMNEDGILSWTTKTMEKELFCWQLIMIYGASTSC